MVLLRLIQTSSSQTKSISPQIHPCYLSAANPRKG